METEQAQRRTSKRGRAARADAAAAANGQKEARTHSCDSSASPAAAASLDAASAASLGVAWSASLSRLAWLLHPVSLSEFFLSYWERQPLHIARRDSGHYGQLLSSAALFRHIATHEDSLQYATDINVCRCQDGEKVDENPLAADDEGEAARQQLAHGRPDMEEEGEDGAEAEEDGSSSGSGAEDAAAYAAVSSSFITSRFAAGSTLQVLQPQRFSPSLLSLLSQLESAFSCLCASNAYLTPPESQGLALHNDDVEVFACQLEGEKEWRLYRPLDVLAREHSRDYRQDEVGEETHRIVLQPGDLLYLPRGTIHQAHTRSRGSDEQQQQRHEPAAPSLHVTISTYQKTAWLDFLRLGLNRALDRLWEEDVAVRRGLPVGFLRYINSAHQAAPASASSSSSPSPHQSLMSGFESQHARLLQSVLSRLDLHAVGDEMAQDFFLHRLPPDAAQQQPPLDRRQWEDWLEMEAEEKYDAGELPVSRLQLVRLLHPEHVHCSIVPPTARTPASAWTAGEEQGRQQRQEHEDGHARSGCLLLTHSLHNDPLLHMDSRHPPPASACLRLPLSLSSPLAALLSAPAAAFVPISRLGAGGLQLCSILHSHALIECRTASSSSQPKGSRAGRIGSRRKG